MSWSVEGWRKEKMTDGQASLIKAIEETRPYNSIPAFTGTTKGEACDYIAKYISIYRETCAEMNDWQKEQDLICEHEDAGDRI